MTNLEATQQILTERILGRVNAFIAWLGQYGESSWDHQSFYAGPFGRKAKALYYRSRMLGMLAVFPMIFSEALIPAGRRLFHKRMRFPIADAHYAMGFAFLAEVLCCDPHYRRAVCFLEELTHSRSRSFQEHCWGYPFDWVTRNGTIAAGTPLITTTPYAYEAFLQVYRLDRDERWRSVLDSIVRHAVQDIMDYPTSSSASTCSYTPFGEYGVVNASAYRAFLLTSAQVELGHDEVSSKAKRNINFVLESQQRDGSWYYAMDGQRSFVDHFHTCFVLKALAKTDRLWGAGQCREAIRKGVDYYLSHLIDEKGLPRPFAKAPRLTVYRRELYDYAECINLCVLLREDYPQMQCTLESVLRDFLNRWVKQDGSFRSRELLLGWDNVPMHRWAQSQMFRSLAYFLRDEKKVVSAPSEQSNVRDLRKV